MSLLSFGFKAVKSGSAEAAGTSKSDTSVLGKRVSSDEPEQIDADFGISVSPAVKRSRPEGATTVGLGSASSSRPASTAPLSDAQETLLAKFGASSIHESWKPVVAAEMAKAYFSKLMAFVAAARSKSTVFPPEGQTFTALYLTPLDSIKVVILGQDPYIQRGQAHGLSFSVPRGQAIPPSLRNMLAEIASDPGATAVSGSSTASAGASSSSSSSSSTGGAKAAAGKAAGPAKHGCLEAWARQGVLLLNAVLTVEAGKSNSHAGAGWEDFTSALIKAVSDRRTGVVFMLWGRPAQLKGGSVDRKKHLVLEAPHPSPLSAHRGFMGCKHFSKANEYLRSRGVAPINWDVDAVVPATPPAAAAAAPAPAAAGSTSSALSSAAAIPAVGGAGAAGPSATAAAEAAHAADAVLAAAAADGDDEAAAAAAAAAADGDDEAAAATASAGAGAGKAE